MKTRTEMIYDFMVAIAANPNMIPNPLKHECSSEEAKSIYENVYLLAAKLTDEYLESL
jgi:hypothetical protein